MEKELGQQIPVINEFIDAQLERLEQFNAHPAKQAGVMHQLNQLLHDTLG